MPGELARRREARLDRVAASEAAVIRREEMIKRAEVERRENVAAYENSLRLTNGYYLTAQAQSYVTSLSTTTTQVCKDKPGLEMAHRELESAYILGAGQLIHGYMTRPRRYG